MLARILAAVILAVGGAGIGLVATASPATWACTSTDPNAWCPVAALNAGSLRQQPAVIGDDWSGSSLVKSQGINVNSASDWQVIANMAAGNKAVLTYPDFQDQLDSWSSATGTIPMPLSAYTSLRSTFSDVMPTKVGSTDDYESAYDIWLTAAGAPSYVRDMEVMVWTYNFNQFPGGHDTGTTYTDPSGAVYEVWASAGSIPVSSRYQLVTFVAKNNTESGSVDLLKLFSWMSANGYTTAPIGIDQVDYGFEICSTSGVPETFMVNGFALDGSTGPAPTPTPTPTPTPPPPPPPPKVTIYGCVSAHKLANTGTAKPTCPSGSTRVHWTATVG